MESLCLFEAFISIQFKNFVYLLLLKKLNITNALLSSNILKLTFI